MAKRGNGEGTIYYSEKLNKWVGQFSAGKKENGHINRVSVYGDTRKEVAKKIIDKQSEFNKNIYVNKDNISLIQLATQFVNNNFKANQFSESSYKRKNETLKRIEKLPIADMPIQKIEILDINNSLLLLKDYSNSVISKACGLISSVFDYAIVLKIIYSNPFKTRNAIIKPKSNKKDRIVDAFTLEEEKLFLNELKKTTDKYRDIFYVAIFTGMRIGEILSLKSNDIDFINRKIKVSRTLTQNKNGKVILGETTKTYSGKREIPILDFLYNILISYRDNDFLFLNCGKFINPSTINTHFKKICKDAGIRKDIYIIKRNKKTVKSKTSNVNTHMLRHTFATRCIESGMSAVALSRILGHKDITTTLNTYTSVFDKFKNDEIEKVKSYMLNNLNVM